jgi:hypothetical protein
MAAVPQAGSAPSLAPPRRVYLDNLRVLLVAGVITAHAVVGYVDVDGLWPYDNVQEVTLSPATSLALLAVAVPFALFLIALLFLVAGLLTPASLDRKGPARFAADRLLRLGVPFAAFTLLLWPALLYALYRPLGHTELSYWAEFAGNYPENGPLWFVGVLLLLSLGYAGWRAVRPGPAVTRPITVPGLLALAAAVAAGTFLLRLAFDLGSQAILDLNEWQWPECIGLFTLGVVAARQGWLDAVPDRLRRQARTATLLAAAVLAASVAVTAVLAIPIEDYAGGRRWPALVLALGEGVLTVFGPIWLLAAAQRHLDRPRRHGAALARASYGAFVLQGLPLLGLAVALRPLAAPAEVKALLVAVGGVAGSFALAHLLVTRVPLTRRVV